MAYSISLTDGHEQTGNAVTYCVALLDCQGLSDSSKQQAEGAFREALERRLGGRDAVLPAHLAYIEVANRHGGLPLPIDASAPDRDTVDRWLDAIGAGDSAAFLGWVSPPTGARFVVST